jgi:hypothetical protein
MPRIFRIAAVACLTLGGAHLSTPKAWAQG